MHIYNKSIPWLQTAWCLLTVSAACCVSDELSFLVLSFREKGSGDRMTLAACYLLFYNNFSIGQ